MQWHILYTDTRNLTSKERNKNGIKVKNPDMRIFTTIASPQLECWNYSIIPCGLYREWPQKALWFSRRGGIEIPIH